ncbi:3-dehydroquinate synthase [Rhodohalobacter mucosus]|uniref:3-dehydroquinate synthase n=1 Tax=Rhodohalobacter mucosus TaxID=2079485 RepID=A0A316TPA2_9BACT|nr:3-dehydroquinate synthase [Rhodohalobacter mucosus]PWN06230.1 3-dehydroquinate synthase [Rhodohalobacter mucosus]
MNRDIEVNTRTGTYIYSAGNGILSRALSDICSRHDCRNLFVIIDENVHRLHGERLRGIIENRSENFSTFIVPAGESSKSFSEWKRVVDFLLENKVRRNSPVLVIGGGVTGDLGGFAAATALRGVPLYHIPTTLLAMVDSSIGGKTGINHQIGKNLIGSFYQPAGVIADISFLETLPRNEWINGLSEILKYAAISDDEIFRQTGFFLDSSLPYYEHDHDDLISLICTCAEVKIDIVEKDEHERGVRAFLNFGHTFGHALEKECGYKTISHGEAVYLGMLAAQKLSLLTGGDAAGDKLEKYGSLYSYRVDKDALSYERLVAHMKADKKNKNRDIHFVLLDSWQHPVVKTVNKESYLKESWDVVFDRL